MQQKNNERKIDMSRSKTGRQIDGCGLNEIKVKVEPMQQTSTERNNTRCEWAGGTCESFPDFCANHQFHVIYCLYSHLYTLF